MQKFENKYFVVEIRDKEVCIKSKEVDVEAYIEPLAVGLSVHGGGQQSYLAHGRDTTFLICDRLAMGMAPIVGLPPRKRGPELLR